jgi:hypothetical protein
VPGFDWELARRRDLERKREEDPPPPDLPPGEPARMSAKQAKYLKALCLQAGRTFDPTMSRRGASALISQLKARQTRRSQQ